jgi:resuscitation-promoting factor RpfA
VRRARVDPDDEIVVRRGDTLWSLAERHLGPGATDGEIALEWPHWFTANRAVIGSDPDHLVPGERLRPPEMDSEGRSLTPAVKDEARSRGVR